MATPLVALRPDSAPLTIAVGLGREVTSGIVEVAAQVGEVVGLIAIDVLTTGDGVDDQHGPRWTA